MRLTASPIFDLSGCDWMPALISHYLHAKRVLKSYLQQGGVPVEKDAFLWGAQGPDFLFSASPIPWRKTAGLRTIGRRMHKENPLPVLNALHDYAVQNSDNIIVRSYFLGFLCHYSFDRTVHPFVYSRIAALKSRYPNGNNTFLHCQIETSLDTILLRYETGKLPTEFNLKRAYPKKPAVQSGIAGIYAYVLQRVYSREVSEKSILCAENDCRFLTGLQNDKTGLKKQILGYLERKNGKYFASCVFRGVMEDDFDYANVLSSEWSYPLHSSKKRKETFFDLYEYSVRESVMFLKKIEQTNDLASLFGTIPFS